MRIIDADELKKRVLKWLPKDPCGREEKEMPFETDICVSVLMEIDEQPTIQSEQRMDLLKVEIKRMKRSFTACPNTDYYTGYMSALSAVEGCIAQWEGANNDT